MSKIIIGIHGLKNKPPKRILRRWWKMAIEDGLKSIKHHGKSFKFVLVYWADILHPHPLNPRETDPEHPLYLRGPYTPSQNTQIKYPSDLKKKMLDILETQMDKLFLNKDMTINFSSITDMIIHRFFSDLEAYYSTPEGETKKYPVKDAIQARLEKKLRKYRHKDIMIIGHSMGSIIGYDVLLVNPSITVQSLITIGSPLGMPVIISRIALEQSCASRSRGKHQKVRTPESVIKSWTNFSDLGDKVALNYNLADDYAANSIHVKVVDKTVTNDYEIKKERNPHKSYGYLRTPEVAKVIASFLDEKIKKYPSFLQRFLKGLWDYRRKSEE
jgi:hypothetical protein